MKLKSLNVLASSRNTFFLRCTYCYDKTYANEAIAISRNEWRISCTRSGATNLPIFTTNHFIMRAEKKDDLYFEFTNKEMFVATYI